jgi:hypothetical protein
VFPFPSANPWAKARLSKLQTEGASKGLSQIGKTCALIKAIHTILEKIVKRKCPQGGEMKDFFREELGLGS